MILLFQKKLILFRKFWNSGPLSGIVHSRYIVKPSFIFYRVGFSGYSGARQNITEILLKVALNIINQLYSISII
jgi:hypothetical protein